MIYFRVVLYCNCLYPGRPDLSWVCSTLRLLLSADEHAWISSVLTKLPCSSWRTEFFVQRIHTDLLRTGRLSFILNTDHVMRDTKSPWSITNWTLELVGLVGRILLVEQLLLLVVEQLPLLVVDQLSSPIPLSNRDVVRSLMEVEGDMYAFSYKTSPVFSLTTTRACARHSSSLSFVPQEMSLNIDINRNSSCEIFWCFSSSAQ